MGRVWAACRVGELGFEKLVAIKVIHVSGAGGKSGRGSFLEEARIGSSIHHPNVCGLHELGEQDGVLYFAMDWSDGVSLREFLDALPERRLEPRLAARIAADACAGLHAAHEAVDETGAWLGVVHRDVSPQNILVGTRGHVRIGDFGIAKARGQLRERTKTGELRGKVSYLAPEQITSRALDRRADVFAMGCVLYEASVGRAPFCGEEELSILYQIVEGEALSPDSLIPSYPDGLQAIVTRAMAKLPEERYPSALEMRHALEAWLASTGLATTEGAVASTLEDAMGASIAERNRSIRDIVRNHELRSDPNETSDIGVDGGLEGALSGETTATTVLDTELSRAPPGKERATHARALSAAVVAFAAILTLGPILMAIRARSSEPAPNPAALRPKLVVAAALGSPARIPSRPAETSSSAPVGENVPEVARALATNRERDRRLRPRQHLHERAGRVGLSPQSVLSASPAASSLFDLAVPPTVAPPAVQPIDEDNPFD